MTGPPMPDWTNREIEKREGLKINPDCQGTHTQEKRGEMKPCPQCGGAVKNSSTNGYRVCMLCEKEMYYDYSYWWVWKEIDRLKEKLATTQHDYQVYFEDIAEELNQERQRAKGLVEALEYYRRGEYLEFSEFHSRYKPIQGASEKAKQALDAYGGGR